MTAAKTAVASRDPSSDASHMDVRRHRIAAAT